MWTILKTWQISEYWSTELHKWKTMRNLVNFWVPRVTLKYKNGSTLIQLSIIIMISWSAKQGRKTDFTSRINWQWLTGTHSKKEFCSWPVMFATNSRWEQQLAVVELTLRRSGLPICAPQSLSRISAGDRHYSTSKFMPPSSWGCVTMWSPFTWF